MQDAEQLHASEDNYLDGIINSTNTSPVLEVEEQVDQTFQNNLVPAKQEFIDEKESAINIPESQKIDTSYSSQWQAASNSISHQDIDLHANLPDCQLQDKEMNILRNKTLLSMTQMYPKINTMVQLLMLLLIA